MVKRNKIFVVIIISIIVIGITIGLYVANEKPSNIIARKYNMILPASTEILNYEHHRKSDYFAAKILIDNQNVENVKSQLITFFGKEAKDDHFNRIPNFKNVCQWWDLDNNNIQTFYTKFVSGEEKLFGYFPKSIDVWAFISKDKDGQYYLYLSY